MKRKQLDLAKRALQLAPKLLKKGEGLEELRLYEFDGDEEAHDDELTERLYDEFSAEAERVREALTKKYGQPSRAGTSGDRAVKLNGVFRYALWDVEGSRLFVAAHHEDRGVPVILWIGIVD